MTNPLYACRVCGLDYSPYNFYPWGEDGKSSTFAICFCCGTEFGYQDCQLSAIHRYRKEWIDKGMQWSEEKKKPEHWDWEKQKENIPTEFR